MRAHGWIMYLYGVSMGILIGTGISLALRKHY